MSGRVQNGSEHGPAHSEPARTASKSRNIGVPTTPTRNKRPYEGLLSVIDPNDGPYGQTSSPPPGLRRL